MGVVIVEREGTVLGESVGRPIVTDGTLLRSCARQPCVFNKSLMRRFFVYFHPEWRHVASTQIKPGVSAEVRVWDNNAVQILRNLWHASLAQFLQNFPDLWDRPTS